MAEIHVVRHDNSHLYETQMEQYFRRRYDVFVGERGWKDIERADRRDIDQFDTADAIHLLALEKDEVIGGLRFNPTTGPTLLSEVFSHLCTPPLPRSPDIWEGTRLWVVKERRHQKLPPAIEALLIAASLELSIALGIKKTRALFETWRLRRNMKIGWPMTPLGPPQDIDGIECIAVDKDASKATWIRVCPQLSVFGPVLIWNGTPRPAYHLPELVRAVA